MPEVVIVQAPAPRRRYVLVAMVALVIGLWLGAAFLHRRENSVITFASAPSVVTVVVTATVPPSPTATTTPTPTPTPTLSPTPSATPTPHPSPTATPTPPPPIGIVRARALNVRAGPGVDYAIIGYAALGQRFRITGANADCSWLRIDFNSLLGWVSARWVELPDRAVHGVYEVAVCWQELQQR